MKASRHGLNTDNIFRNSRLKCNMTNTNLNEYLIVITLGKYC